MIDNVSILTISEIGRHILGDPNIFFYKTRVHFYTATGPMPTDFNAFSRNLLRTFKIESYYQENRCGKDRLILKVFSVLKNKGQVHKQ